MAQQQLLLLGCTTCLLLCGSVAAVMAVGVLCREALVARGGTCARKEPPTSSFILAFSRHLSYKDLPRNLGMEKPKWVLQTVPWKDRGSWLLTLLSFSKWGGTHRFGSCSWQWAVLAWGVGWCRPSETVFPTLSVWLFSMFSLHYVAILS